MAPKNNTAKTAENNESVAAVAKSKREETAELLQGEKRTKIIIPSTELDDNHVYLSINGYGFLIQRDVEVAVPDSVLSVLDDATIDSFRMVDGKVKPFKQQRYPYQVVREKSVEDGGK